MKKRYVYRILEFFIVGLAMGITEDLIAIHFATDAVITANVVLVAAMVALPFAIFSELVVDWKHMKFLRKRWTMNLSKEKKALKSLKTISLSK
jgi:uncharacterized membrane protein (DUF106 family)